MLINPYSASNSNNIVDVTKRGIGFRDVQKFNLALLAKQRTKLSMDSMLRNIAYEEYSSKWYF